MRCYCTVMSEKDEQRKPINDRIVKAKENWTSKGHLKGVESH